MHVHSNKFVSKEWCPFNPLMPVDTFMCHNIISDWNAASDVHRVKITEMFCNWLRVYVRSFEITKRRLIDICVKELRQHLDLGVTEPMQCTMPCEGYLLNLTYKSKPWMHLLAIATWEQQLEWLMKAAKWNWHVIKYCVRCGRANWRGSPLFSHPHRNLTLYRSTPWRRCSTESPCARLLFLYWKWKVGHWREGSRTYIQANYSGQAAVSVLPVV